ncbi:PD-(D/E)XK nuclease family protein [Egbenema bharatensis]|uniref:PD-(D/E)XK nuclease family protein n=1 Tax=Egbenema bharatensis TaxID=3463334 RepID=UPI003A87ADA4
MLHLSQGQLNLLQTCPRKFQHIYIEQLGFPIAPDHQDRLNWGQQFHLLMQQRELGLPIDRISAPLHQTVESFVQAAPEVFHTPPDTRQSEHRRSLEFQGYLLTVIYDLLVMDDRQAQILDWKTYPRPQQSSWLKQNWQTRLYPFVLAETSEYDPDQISMTYWFIQNQAAPGIPEPNQSDRPCQPESITYSYSHQQHQQTHQELTRLLTQLTHWLDRYQQGEPFPQAPTSSPHCDTCTFTIRCQRTSWIPPQRLPDFTTIEEVRFG